MDIWLAVRGAKEAQKDGQRPNVSGLAVRVGLIQVTQESNTFAPGLTTLEGFHEGVLSEGSAILEEDPGGWLTGALADLATWPVPVEPVPVLRAGAVPGPALANDTLEELLRLLSTRLRDVHSLDGVLLILHGACITESGESADAALASAVRDIVGPAVPVVAALDHHAYVTEKLVTSVDGLVAHRTQPHDLVDTGRQAAGLLRRIVCDGVRPSMHWRRIPMVTHQEQFVTKSGPMASWFRSARSHEASTGVLSVSLFPMQPWLDVEHGGWTALAVTRAAEDGAAIANDLAREAWEQRQEFMRTSAFPASVAISRACQTAGLTLVSDLGDSVFGGGPGNSTVLLKSLLGTDLPGSALVPMFDPDAVASCMTQGIGSSITLTVGTKTCPGGPVSVEGRITATADGVLQLPGFLWERADYGRCVLLRTGQVDLMLTERRGVSGNHPAAYERLGVAVDRACLAVLKSAANTQGYDAYSPGHVQADTPGCTQSDVRALPWRRLSRPIFPLDEDLAAANTEFEAAATAFEDDQSK